MKQQAIKAQVPIPRNKIIVLYALYATSSLIAISGAFFTIFAYLNHYTFKVFNTSVPGIVFGVLVLYLGIRYFLSVMKLKADLYSPEARFSWSNFKKQKAAKNR